MDHQPVWIWLIPIAMVGVGYLIASTRKGSVASARMGSRRLELYSAADPAAVFAKISALRGRLTVDDADATANVLVLASPVTLGTWGFLYPVRIHAANGGSRIEVGIVSKLFQWGPLVTRAHKQCIADLTELLGMPEARVA